MRLPFAPLFLVLPLLEIAVFVIVGRQIGVLPTLGLVALTTLIGSLLLRRQGFGALRRITEEAQAGRIAGRDLVDGLMIALAGTLLIVPGFITDLFGLLLFIPAVRNRVWSLIGRRIVVFGGGVRGGGARRGEGQGPTIDLDAEDYRSTPSSDSPWRRTPIERSR